MFGEVLHGGDTKFAKGQLVYFSKYSAVNVIDFKSVYDGTKDLSEAQKESMIICASDDVMAYDDSAISEVA